MYIYTIYVQVFSNIDAPPIFFVAL